MVEEAGDALEHGVGHRQRLLRQKERQGPAQAHHDPGEDHAEHALTQREREPAAAKRDRQQNSQKGDAASGEQEGTCVRGLVEEVKDRRKEHEGTECP